MCFLLMILIFEICYEFDECDDINEGSEYNDECDDKCDDENDIYMIYEHIDLYGIDLLG